MVLWNQEGKSVQKNFFYNLFQLKILMLYL